VRGVSGVRAAARVTSDSGVERASATRRRRAAAGSTAIPPERVQSRWSTVRWTTVRTHSLSGPSGRSGQRAQRRAATAHRRELERACTAQWTPDVLVPAARKCLAIFALVQVYSLCVDDSNFNDTISSFCHSPP